MSKKNKSFAQEYGVPLSIFIVGILISISIYAGSKGSNVDEEIEDISSRLSDIEKVISPTDLGNNAQPQDIPPAQDVTVSIDDDPILGDKDAAKVAIVEFSDYECPFCEKFKSGAMAKIREEYINSNKAILVFRDLPLDFHDPAATREAVAGECVQDIGGDDKYFEYHDKIFETSPGNGGGISDADLSKLAGEIGVDEGKVKTCIEDGKFSDEVINDKDDAAAAGINGTPGFVVGKLDSDGNVEGEVVSGALPFESFKPIIEKYL